LVFSVEELRVTADGGTGEHPYKDVDNQSRWYAAVYLVPGIL